MEKYYSFAGIDFSVSASEELMYSDDRMLAPFRSDRMSNPHRFEFVQVDKLSLPFGNVATVMDSFVEYSDGDIRLRYIGTVNGDITSAHIRAEHRGKYHSVQLKKSAYPSGLGPKVVLNALMAEHLVVQNGGFMFHCSFIDRDGKAVLFTAPSGTGKSTQADLWNEHRGCEIVNGDRAVVRLADGHILAEGIPFAGSSKYCKNKSLPLGAIVYLAQAEKTSVSKMRGYEAFLKIWEGVSVNSWDKDDMSRVSQTVKTVVEQVPVFYMPCTPNKSAVEVLEQHLRKWDNT